MTDDEFKRARTLKHEISICKCSIEELIDEVPVPLIPKEMHDKHVTERRAYLETELARLEAEFDAI